MPAELCWMSAIELAARIQSKQVSPVEVLEAHLAQIGRVDPRVKAFITRCDNLARQSARAAEEAVMRGEPLGPLHGVPVAVKDLHVTAGIRTTFGSKLFENFVPDWDQPIVAALKRAGAVILGKTNTAEFGLVPLVCNSLLGDSLNPWHADYNTGGSSGGSAAAVVCGMAPLATGSDGGGSIRVPASFCGAFGIKPHMGRVPNVPFPRGWESLSHHGPLSRHVADAALMLDVVSVPHAADRWALPPHEGRFQDACTADAKGLKLAWCARLGSLPIEPEVRLLCEQGARRFEQLGCHVDEVELDLPDIRRAQQIIVLCEAATAFADRRDEWERVIYPGLSRMLPHADQLTYHDLVRAHWERDEYWERLAPLFDNYDALLTPVASVSATLNGTFGPDQIEGQPARALAWLSFCVPFNMTWQPAASIPVGRDSLGIPIGLQLVGRRFDEATLFRLSSAYEEAFPWTTERPPAVA